MLSLSFLSPIRVLVVDDHFAVRKGLNHFLSQKDSIEVTAVVANGKEALDLLLTESPGIVITDVKMPVMDGKELCRTIRRLCPLVKVIAYTMFDDGEAISDMRKAGASGYILKTSHEEEIVKALFAVGGGGEYYCTEVKKRIDTIFGIGRFGQAVEEKKQSFSETERKIIGLVCQEKSSKDIAQELNLSKRTVEHYQEKIRSKMGVHSVVGIAVQAVANWLFY